MLFLPLFQRRRSISYWNKHWPLWPRCPSPTCWRNGGGKCLMGISQRMNGWSSGGTWSESVCCSTCNVHCGCGIARCCDARRQYYSLSSFSLPGGIWLVWWSRFPGTRPTVTLQPSSMYLETILSSGAALTRKLTRDKRYQAFSMGCL